MNTNFKSEHLFHDSPWGWLLGYRTQRQTQQGPAQKGALSWEHGGKEEDGRHVNNYTPVYNRSCLRRA